ncbi:phosphoribosylaminoimidazole carboxylase [Golovinomyces cichoracearum]|uniref:Phosphoribosylaminoimidazole carboxylase n=1 Tax=Golovinomyces cichoracearum TaxID=62708 RepID=A0A420HCY0_9PEZI|nr:phosphoribosylaminoimidazole carboxylase [Golovinomyces cichoracearum]
MKNSGLSQLMDKNMNTTIGLLGGGQLGQMLCEAANPLGVSVVVLDAPNSPAKQVNSRVSHIDGSYTDPEKIRELARRVDILTIETEHVDTYVLEEIAEKGVEVADRYGNISMKKVQVQPNWRTIRIIQDKFKQKQHLMAHGVQTVMAESVKPDPTDLNVFGSTFGFPFMLKTRKNAYDGRGNFIVKTSVQIEKALEEFRTKDLYAEKWANFRMELAVMVVKFEEGLTSDGLGTVAYPVVETIHQDSICHLVYAPARGISDDVQQRAKKIAQKAVGCLWGRGVFGVELFLLQDGEIVVNEIAPRPHNSGHYTIEACPTFSQYKSQLLSILEIRPHFPESVVPLLSPATIMLNILGGVNKKSHEALVEKALLIPSAALHLYGKESRPGRKIGHISIISSTMSEGI